MRNSGIDIRQRAFRFAKRMVRTADEPYKGGGSARLIARQLLASGTAVGANLEEAEADHSRLEFIARCNIARREAREALYWLRSHQSATCRPLTASLVTSGKQTR